MDCCEAMAAVHEQGSSGADGEEPKHSSALYQRHSRGTVGLRRNDLYKESQLIRFLLGYFSRLISLRTVWAAMLKPSGIP